MKVLVVGASGRTGKRVVQEARAAGHTVRALARSLRTEQAAEGLEVLAARASPVWQSVRSRAWTP